MNAGSNNGIFALLVDPVDIRGFPKPCHTKIKTILDRKKKGNCLKCSAQRDKLKTKKQSHVHQNWSLLSFKLSELKIAKENNLLLSVGMRSNPQSGNESPNWITSGSFY